MGDVATIEGKALPEKMGNIRFGGTVKAIIPHNLDDVYRLANLLHKSGLAPKDMQNPEAITVALLHGMEIGLPPMMAIQRIAVINGRPSLWGDAALGLVRASGQLEILREFIEGVGEARYAVCEVKRKGEELHRSVFSVADAKRANLWNKTSSTGKPTPWVTHPDRMLKMRARGFALRDLFSDVLGGLYLTEELQGEESMRDVSPPSPPPAPPKAPELSKQIEGSQAPVMDLPALLDDWKARLAELERHDQDNLFESEIEPRRDAGELGHAEYNSLVALLKDPPGELDALEQIIRPNAK